MNDDVKMYFIPVEVDCIASGRYPLSVRIFSLTRTFSGMMPHRKVNLELTAQGEVSQQRFGHHGQGDA